MKIGSFGLAMAGLTMIYFLIFITTIAAFGQSYGQAFHYALKASSWVCALFLISMAVMIFWKERSAFSVAIFLFGASAITKGISIASYSPEERNAIPSALLILLLLLASLVVFLGKNKGAVQKLLIFYISLPIGISASFCLIEANHWLLGSIVFITDIFLKIFVSLRPNLQKKALFMGMS